MAYFNGQNLPFVLMRGEKGDTGERGFSGTYWDVADAKKYLSTLAASKKVYFMNIGETSMFFNATTIEGQYEVKAGETWKVENDADHTGWRNATFTKIR